MIIYIPNIDGVIWNPEIKVAEIIKEYQTHGRVEISLNDEGPDSSELGLYSLLDSICDRYGFSKRNITIYTRNCLESHKEYQIKIDEPLYVPEGQEFAQQHDYRYKKFNLDFKHFGLFIGRSNWHRLWVGSEMYSNYQEKTCLTFHYDRDSDYHKGHLGIEHLLHIRGNAYNFSAIQKLLENCPIRNSTVNEYPIISPAHFEISKQYPNFLVELVCETYCLGKSFYPTEKTWRPIINKTPFMTIGPNNFLKNLRKLGFRTFDTWWSESYDEDGGVIAIEDILSTVDRLAKMSIDDLENLYSDMLPTLEHNYQCFMNLTPTDFLTLDYESI